MQTVKHKIFGRGEVVGREVKENSITITVKFNNGKEMRFAIPQSFETGILEAEGSLKDELEAVIALKKERTEDSIKSAAVARANKVSLNSLAKHSAGSSKKTAPTDVVASSYEEYLIKAGYSVETDSGNPSTVSAYVKAVDSVLEKEGISWSTLKNNIDDIVKKYDVGGEEEVFGNKSNKTVINALKRFNEFVNP